MLFWVLSEEVLGSSSRLWLIVHGLNRTHLLNSAILDCTVTATATTPVVACILGVNIAVDVGHLSIIIVIIILDTVRLILISMIGDHVRS